MSAKTKRRLLNRPLPVVALSNRSVRAIKPYPNNPRDHSPRQIRAIARSIASSGFLNPIIVDEAGEIIAGHGRLEAAKLAGLAEVPVLTASNLSEAQKRAYRIADNRLAEVGSSWSLDKLELEVGSILELDIDFDIELTGFDLRELELQFDAAAPEEPEEEGVPPLPTRSVSRIGDMWRIGDHLLVCGDATEQESYRKLLGREPAAMMFTDPPFNVPIRGHVTGNGRTGHREFIQASGEMSETEFQQFLLSFMMLASRFARPGSLHFICMDWRGLKPLLLAAAVAYDEQVNLCVWAKTNAGMGSLYRSQHELVGVFKNGRAAHLNNVELGRNGRHRSNLWTYAGMNSFSAERDEALAMHPTVKPLALVRDAILDVSRRGDIILDPFGGSGTTLIAAEKTGRRARLIELDPLYCDLIITRAARTLGLVAVHADLDQNFGQVSAARSDGNE